MSLDQTDCHGGSNGVASRSPLAESSSVAWERFQWRCGAETYFYEIRDQGLIGRINVSDGRTFALPVAVWEAMLEAVKTTRKSKDRVMAQGYLPPRAGARWSAEESDELAAKFRSGRNIATLASEHARTVGAIEHELWRQGLWDKIEKRRLLATAVSVTPPSVSSQFAANDDIVP